MESFFEPALACYKEISWKRDETKNGRQFATQSSFFRRIGVVQAKLLVLERKEDAEVALVQESAQNVEQNTDLREREDWKHEMLISR